MSPPTTAPVAALSVIEADITSLRVDAIVNAANESLLGGGGVDGAIHRAAGPGLLAECRSIPEVAPGVRCPTGEARITRGHQLSAQWVIHVVGPVWQGGDHDEARRLSACYLNALVLAKAAAAVSIAFPAISCGVFGFPPGKAVPVAVATVRQWLDDHAMPERVVFACTGATMAYRYRRVLAGLD